VEALKHEPSLRGIYVECKASPEQVGWLTELRRVEALTLMGKDKGDLHLKSLSRAAHLTHLEFVDTSVTVAEVKRLQQILVGCDIRMMNAGTQIVGPPSLPAPVTRRVNQ
jgi:hypothetical protein